MIVSKTVLVGVKAQTIEYWISRGYSIPEYIDSRKRVK